MRATFSLSRDDFTLLTRAVKVRYQAQHGRFNAAFLLQVLAWFCLGIAATSFAKIWHQDPLAAKPFAVLAVLLLVAFIAAVLVPFAAQWSFRKHVVTPGGAFLATQTVEASADGLSMSSSAAKSEVPWAAVLGRVEDARNHYLFIDATQAIVTPKSAVAELGSPFEQRLRSIKSEA